MKLKDLVDLASYGCLDGAMLRRLWRVRKQPNLERYGDTLALFILRELMTTYTPGSESLVQVTHGVLALRPAILELLKVASGLARVSEYLSVPEELAPRDPAYLRLLMRKPICGPLRKVYYRPCPRKHKCKGHVVILEWESSSDAQDTYLESRKAPGLLTGKEAMPADRKLGCLRCNTGVPWDHGKGWQFHIPRVAPRLPRI